MESRDGLKSSSLAVDNTDSVFAALDSLLNQADTLLEEVNQLTEVITATSNYPAFALIPGLAKVSREIEAEKAGFEKLRSSIGDPKIWVKIKAANIPYFYARWCAVKRRRQLVSLTQVFRRQDKWTFPTLKKPSMNGLLPNQAKDVLRTHKIQNSAECDAVVEGGAEWIKVSAATPKRWIMEMADAGIFIDDEDDEAEAGGEHDEYDEDITILRKVKQLVEASRANPYKVRTYARVRVVLTKIEEGKVAEVDWLLKRIRCLGDLDVEVVVDCANGEFLNSPLPPMEEVLKNLVFTKDENQVPSKSDTLVIDTNIIIGYVSDITNSRLEIQPGQTPDTKAHIRAENEGGEGQQFVPVFHDLVGGHSLCCTRSVLESARKIATTIATTTERARYRLVVPWEELDQEDRDQLPGPNMTQQERVEQFKGLSRHDIPLDLQLPIQVVDGTWDLSKVEELVSEKQLPRYAVPVVKGMGTATIGPIIYGWASRQTVLTGSLTFVGRFISLINLYGKDHGAVLNPGEEAPSVLKVRLFRSLLAKRRPADMPCPPRRVRHGDHWRGIKVIPPGLENGTGAGSGSEGYENKAG
ncbi:hypothetical protein MKZ38_008380 [Zalerion maritima]|uniref:Uncharacterized protein n=1 Tax=Zalerion maritima TaxID=339359 RepID=A0AAD5WV70_9PEZI|nr:hypothetical protein MKZ38_008380 [Zalerion maritima]